MPDGHVNHIQIGHRGEELQPIGGNSLDDVAVIRRHKVPAVFGGERLRVLFGLLKVAAELDEIGTLRAHGGIFLGAVSLRHDDVRRHVEPARRQRHRLAVIAARRRDQAPYVDRSAKQFRGIHHRSTRLEGSDGSVVLMFHPHFGAQPLAQQRPDDLRRRRHHGIHQLLGIFDFVDGWQRGGDCGFVGH